MQTQRASNGRTFSGAKNHSATNKRARVWRGAWALCLSLVLVALSSSPLAAQSNIPATNSATAYAAQTSRALADAAKLVTEFEVNGLKVLVKRREGSQTVAAGLFLRGGARNVDEKNAGVEPLMLDLASEASANFPRERMRTELSRMGTGIGYGINYDYSVLSLGSTRQSFDRSWQIFTDVALRPSFAPDDFARVKNRLVVSLSDDTDTPDSYLQLLQSKIAYAGHPYLNNPRGTVESVSRLTPEDVKRYHQQMLQTSRLLLVIVGDLDPQMIRERVAATFGKLPRGDYRPTAPPQLTFSASTVDITQRGLPTNYVQGLFAAPALTAPDIYPMRVAANILRDRIFYEVRVKRNLSYAPDAFLGSQGANTGGIYVTAVDANQAVQVMLGEINRLQREPINADDIKSQVQQHLTRYYLSQETNAAQAGELAQYELIGGGWRNSVEVIDRLRAVTPEDVQRVAKTYMRNIRFVVLGDPKSVNKTIFIGQAGE
ncbi:MAG: insulinase family protein [Acidobacteria bacterium]|nr:insulinase family protein [Acidobacteriota bacterium]